jgi:hypothetical protein
MNLYMGYNHIWVHNRLQSVLDYEVYGHILDYGDLTPAPVVCTVNSHGSCYEGVVHIWF